MKLFLPLLMSVAGTACANPVAVASVEKYWERCVISAGEDSSTVSCAVGYKVNEFPDQHFQVSVPVFLPKGTPNDKASVLKLVKPRLELYGAVIKPQHIVPVDDPFIPDGAARVDCYFTLAKAPSKKFAMVVTYEQPTIDGKIIYVPQFESGTNPKDYAEFSVSIFPTQGGTVFLESKHKEKPKTFATRLSVTPFHNEIIIARFKKSEQNVVE